jgi:hypothetical protein
MPDDTRGSPQFSDGSRFDDAEHGFVVPAMYAVSKNLRGLTSDQRLRVLHAVAVLYGIIKPIDVAPLPTPSRSHRPPRITGGSIQARILVQLQQGGSANAIDLARDLSARLETVRSSLSKLTADGRINRTGHGVYEVVPDKSEEKT